MKLIIIAVPNKELNIEEFIKTVDKLAKKPLLINVLEEAQLIPVVKDTTTKTVRAILDLAEATVCMPCEGVFPKDRFKRNLLNLVLQGKIDIAVLQGITKHTYTAAECEMLRDFHVEEVPTLCLNALNAL